jgi:hypothetical protein
MGTAQDPDRGLRKRHETPAVPEIKIFSGTTVVLVSANAQGLLAPLRTLVCAS